MQEGVAFHDLALAIVDEQHRFGVHQRLALRDKGGEGGRVPHQLVMTATPIPRTLRSDERRVGKQCVSTCSSRLSPYHETKNMHQTAYLTITQPSGTVRLYIT